jgi:two-component system chemotaxis response regulator CheB
MSKRAIVIGTSAGGLYVLTEILQRLPEDYPIPIIIVQHRSKDERELLEKIMEDKCKINICQAEEKEKIKEGNVYFAPPNYHLLVEKNFTFSLTNDPLVNYSRPSIDVLFHTAANAYKNKLTGIILTGANRDGAEGIKKIKEKGGITIVQNPKTAEFNTMPTQAAATGCADFLMDLEEIIEYLLKIEE